MKLWLSILIGFSWVAGGLFAQSVDRDEFTDTLNKTINFINYTGNNQQIDTITQITGIGSGLAAGLVRDRNGNSSFGAKYSVIHVLGTPDEKGKPADIIVLLPDAGVDHIDNIRRITSAYLTAMYGYAKPDADILAVFITIYNAVYRGNLALFTNRYKASVLKYLSAEKVGLALNYQDWPGKSQIVIPLSQTAMDKNGKALSAVSTATIVTPQVIETIRDQPGKGTKERQDLTTLMDKSVDQDQNAIDQKKAQLAAETAANQKRQQEIDAKLASDKAARDASKTATSDKTATSQVTTAATNTDKTVSDNAAASKTLSIAETKALTDEKQKLADDQKRIQTETKQLDTRQAETKETAAASKDLRTATATDLKDQGQPTAVSATPIVVLKTSLENGLILAQPQRVVIATAEVLQQSSLKTLIGRRLFNFGDAWLGLLQEGTAARLVLLSTKDLELTKKGSSVISPYSELILLPGNTECLAVMQIQGEWYLAAFDLQLNPVKDKHSVIPVDPVGAIILADGKVIVQRKDGRFTNLDLQDLRVGK